MAPSAASARSLEYRRHQRPSSPKPQKRGTSREGPPLKTLGLDLLGYLGYFQGEGQVIDGPVRGVRKLGERRRRLGGGDPKILETLNLQRRYLQGEGQVVDGRVGGIRRHAERRRCLDGGDPQTLNSKGVLPPIPVGESTDPLL